MFVSHSYITVRPKIATLKTEPMCKSETSVSTYKFLRYQTPEDQNSRTKYSLPRIQKEAQNRNHKFSKLFVGIIWISVDFTPHKLEVSQIRCIHNFNRAYKNE
jgi:hypothetical protein